jgi:hypothetical protein
MATLVDTSNVIDRMTGAGRVEAAGDVAKASAEGLKAATRVL